LSIFDTKKNKKNIMKIKSVLLGVLMVFLVISNSNAQIKLGDKAIGAIEKGAKGVSFSDEDAVAMAKAAIKQMDKENPVAGPKDKYTIRLKKLFGKHTKENGLKLNFKVYKVKDINAFACADGSVRVFAGLMDIMDDNEILAVIGHEIGHVANHDTRDAIKAAYKKEALMDAVASQSDKVAAISNSDLGKLGNAMIDSKHSRKQEADADLYSYEFMKRNKYNVNAVESAFNILAKLSEGSDASILDRMMSSHPGAEARAKKSKKRAEKDGLYKEYVSKKTAKTSKKKK
jgi:metalloprotease